jgi:hypothetical protein
VIGSRYPANRSSAMTYTIAAHPGINITLVYDSLPLGSVNRDALRGVLDGGDIVSMDTPELLVMFSPTQKLVLQLGDRRLRAIDQGNHAPDQSQLPSIVTRAHKAVKSSHLRAYGFNYDLIINWQSAQPIELFLREYFVRDVQHLEQNIGGELAAFVPRVQFRRHGRQYDLLMEPKSEQQLAVHLNVHFEESQLPTQNKLRTSFLSEYEALTQLLARFLEG